MVEDGLEKGVAAVVAQGFEMSDENGRYQSEV